MKVETTRFGEINIENDKVISVPEGILGFPSSRRYIILDHYKKEVPFKWFQSLDDPSLAFVIIDPMLFKPDYMIDDQMPEISDIIESDSDELLVLTIVTILKKPWQITANLLSPIIINISTKVAKQVVLLDSGYDTRYSISSQENSQENECSDKNTLQCNP